MSQLLINLSFLLSNPTGLSIYANNLIPHLNSLEPIALATKQVSNCNSYIIDNNLTPDGEKHRHLDRLIWIQFQLPKIYNRLNGTLLFSPIPEAPIFSNCRYIVTVHDYIPLRFFRRSSPLSQYFRWWVPQVLNQAEHIICNSVATAIETSHRFQIHPSKITAIQLAYDRSHFYYDKSQDRAKQPYFIYIGRHDPHKNVERIISAFARLPNFNDYQLWLVGSCDSRYTPKLRSQATALGIEKQVKFLEYLPYAELPQAIGQATALIFPSLWEGFGLPVLEAMACGTPVITSNLSSLPEVAGDAAILIDPHNVDRIANAMRMLAEDAQLRSTLQQAGLARAKLFSWEQTGKETAAVLEKYL